MTLLSSWRFSRYSAPIHWLVHGHMTSNNETVSRQMPWAGNIVNHATLLWRKDDEDSFSPKLRVRIRVTTTRHMVSFIDFYFHFLANFQTYKTSPHMSVLYIYLYYVTCHTQWAWVTYTKSYITGIKILVNPGLASSGFEQPGQG